MFSSGGTKGIPKNLLNFWLNNGANWMKNFQKYILLFLAGVIKDYCLFVKQHLKHNLRCVTANVP